MKISLKFLMGAMVLAALAINGLLSHHRSNEIQADCENLESSLASIKKTTKSFDERKLVYQRAFDGFARQSRWMV